MLIFLIVILCIAALLEYFSLRGGTSCVKTELRLSETRTEPGETVQLITTVRNLDLLPVSYIALQTAFPLATSFPEGASVTRDMNTKIVLDSYRLWSRQQVTRTMPFSIEKRGVHTISGKKIQRGDFLGFRTVSDYLSQHRDLLVYPRRLENTALLEALGNYCGEMSARRWLIRDPILTLGIREYTANDPMRTISWSQTARRGELMVREFDYTRSLNCCIVFCTNGLNPDESALLDTCCSAVRTVCEELVARGIEMQLYTNSALAGYRRERFRKCSAAKGRMQDVLDILARVTTQACCSESTIIEACLNAEPDAEAYFLVVPHRSPDSEQALQMLNERIGSSAMVFAADTLEVQ